MRPQPPDSFFALVCLLAFALPALTAVAVAWWRYLTLGAGQ